MFKSDKHTSKSILLVENSSRDFFYSRMSYANYLLKNSFQVSVLVPDDGFSENIRTSGLSVFTYSVSSSKSWLSTFINIFFGYRKIIKSKKFDIIHSYRFFPNLFNVITSGLSKRKVVLHVTGLGIFYSRRGVFYNFFKIVSNALYFFMLGIADFVIVQNPEDKEQLCFLPSFKRKILVIKGSGVNTNLFLFDLGKREDLRREYGFTEHDILFLCVTRLIWEKGIRELVIAFRALENTHPYLKLVIVGDADHSNPAHVDPAYIENENKGNVFFLGKKSKIYEILPAADVFIFPSYYREGIPRGILEALSTGLPIITTKMPGCDLTVVEGKNGLLISPRSSNAIKDAIIQLISKKEDFVEMGKFSRTLALNVFSEEKIFSEIFEVYGKD